MRVADPGQPVGGRVVGGEWVREGAPRRQLPGTQNPSEHLRANVVHSVLQVEGTHTEIDVPGAAEAITQGAPRLRWLEAF